MQCDAARHFLSSFKSRIVIHLSSLRHAPIEQLRKFDDKSDDIFWNNKTLLEYFHPAGASRLNLAYTLL